MCITRPSLRTAGLALTLAFLLSGLALSDTASAARKTVTCERPGFVMGVRYGPNFGLAVSGRLKLTVRPSGDTKGTITNNGGRKFRLVGHIQGRSISLLVAYGKTGAIVGTGMMQHKIERCSGFVGGTFSGPSEGDLGDWGFCCFEPVDQLEVRGPGRFPITTSFGNGMQSMGSPPVGTNFPVVKNPRFENGQFVLDTNGAFIKDGAILIVEPPPPFAPEYLPLVRDDATQTASAGPVAPSGVELRQLIARGKTVRIRIMNPDGKSSLSAMFTRF